MRLQQYQPNQDFPEGLEIKPMCEADLDEVMEIEEVSFPTPWSRSSYETELQQNSLSVYLSARKHGKLVGYAGMWIIIDEGHITNVAIHPGERNQGLGYLLMNELIRVSAAYNVKAITLEVRPSNRSAQALYRRLGFVPNGVRKGYYTDSGEDAIIMWKYLVPAKK
ncbi:MAG: ribosomal protein S18-alanine N-acetyltransferase [Firmicutes bacterium]|nr:ribosomal protein S18-alanine N-acetyltransferase [Bacillota bacterium]